MIEPITLGVVLFLTVIIGVGVYFSKWVKGKSSRYLVADRKLALVIASATMMAQSIDADLILGITNLSFLYGFWSGAVMIIGLSGALILIGLFFAEPLNKLRLLTLPDFYKQKYGRAVEIIVSILMVLSSAIFIGGCLVAVGFISQSFLGIPYWLGVVIVAVAILLYIIPGGLVSIVHTDLIQLSMIFIGTMTVIIFIATTFGFNGIIPQGVSDINQLTNPARGAFVNWAILLALGFGNIIAIDFMGRIFATNNPKTAKKACYIAGIGTFLVGIPFILIAESSINLFTTLNISADPTTEPVLFTLLTHVSPAVPSFLILMGIFAAAISTADGITLAASAIVSHNILGYTSRDRIDHKNTLLLMSRLDTIPIMALGVLFALSIPTPGILIILSFDVLLAGAVVPFILGVFWSRSNTPAAIASLLGGSLTRLILFVLTPTFYGVPNTILYIGGVFTSTFDGIPTIISPIISLAIFVVVALATQKSHPPNIEK